MDAALTEQTFGLTPAPVNEAVATLLPAAKPAVEQVQAGRGIAGMVRLFSPPG